MGVNPDGLGERLPTLLADGLLLRSLAYEDAGDVLGLFGDADVVRFMSLEQIGSIDDAKEFISSVHRDFASGRLYQWGIELDREIVGTCTLSAIDRKHRRAELGFAVVRRLWGLRIASRAAPAVIEFGFERMCLHRIEAEVDPENSASIRVLERAGFAREGVLRGRYFESGEARDSIFYGLVRTAAP